MRRLYSAVFLSFLIVVLPLAFRINAAPLDGSGGQKDPEIVGGHEATPGAWPSMVSIGSAYESNGYYAHFCGGSLIRANWVLTAAHCTEGESAASIRVVVGRHTLSSNDGERLAVSRIVVHPSYDFQTTDNDIALLELTIPATAGAPTPFIRADQTGLAAPQGCSVLLDSDVVQDVVQVHAVVE